MAQKQRMRGGRAEREHIGRKAPGRKVLNVLNAVKFMISSRVRDMVEKLSRGDSTFEKKP